MMACRAVSWWMPVAFWMSHHRMRTLLKLVVEPYRRVSRCSTIGFFRYGLRTCLATTVPSSTAGYEAWLAEALLAGVK